MPLPATGSISFSQVNTEIQRTSTATLSLNNSTVRTVAGVGGSGTTISMSDLRGKSYFVIQNSPVTNSSFEDMVLYNGNVPGVYLDFTSDGGWIASGILVGTIETGNWGSPTTTGIGSNYWIRFTRTAENNSSGTSTASTGWLQLSSTRGVYAVKNNANTGFYTATYTIEISTNSSGTNIVRTATGILLIAGVDI